MEKGDSLREAALAATLDEILANFRPAPLANSPSSRVPTGILRRPGSESANPTGKAGIQKDEFRAKKINLTNPLCPLPAVPNSRPVSHSVAAQPVAKLN